MNNKFFTFSKPFLDFIDNGHFYRKPFGWLYVFMAVINLAVPLAILKKGLDFEIFDAPAKYSVLFISVWAVIAFASWISFQLWMDRKAKVESTSMVGDDFMATPVFSHFFQTMGEWMGTWIAIVGFFVALMITIVLGEESSYFTEGLGIGFITSGFSSVVVLPLVGFFIIVITRFLAEQFRALTSIANSTAQNTRHIKTAVTVPGTNSGDFATQTITPSF
jgi:hypothetical protein